MGNKVTYDLIWEGKVNTAKNIFRDLGSGYEKCVDVFTEEELVKTFDFFNRHAEKGDDEGADIAMCEDFIEASQDFLSKKSYQLLKSC